MPSMYLIALSLILLGLGWFYWKLFPRPLPGIPYNPDSLGRPLGDLHEIKRQAKLSGEPSQGLFDAADRLGSPIVQLLLTKFSAPLVIVNDPREVEDILIRRNKEFDRSELTTQFFKPMLPSCTIAQLTTPALKAQKRLWSDVMSTDFLRRVVAPRVHGAALEMVELWRARVRKIGDEDPFEVRRDFEHAALDAIWIAILGSKLGVLRREIDALQNYGDMVDEETRQGLERCEIVQRAMEHINQIVEAGYNSLWPTLTFWWIRLNPKFRHLKRTADGELQRLMREACERFQRIDATGTSEGEEFDTCAMDLVLRREIITAKKQGREVPDPTQDPAMLQELMLLLLAGHDSTANTLSWFVKLIAMYPQVQDTLRQKLQTAYEGSKPSTAEIIDTDIPYLDAVVEETVRVSVTAGIIGRRATVDTEVLGCPIPKGTNVILNTRLSRPLPAEKGGVSEELRSATSRAAQQKRSRGGLYGDSGKNLDVFEPRRWLTRDESGKEVFDAYALPALVFGGGLRGCFGKRLAMQTLRIMIVLMILKFEFLPLPEELTSMVAVEKIFRRPKLCKVKLRAL
ncbi:cytochrome P450 [Diplogelasinospora grovesii]|uniref:Cytochrome P450 n=1 Tax=Diplogelasinospora grovesii TaxID=303347 RepID=A0AAN6S2Z8_9PEZI|nr:cytochrome P450 [Diplogelasinospora grovesii]